MFLFFSNIVTTADELSHNSNTFLLPGSRAWLTSCKWAVSSAWVRVSTKSHGSNVFKWSWHVLAYGRIILASLQYRFCRQSYSLPRSLKAVNRQERNVPNVANTYEKVLNYYPYSNEEGAAGGRSTLSFPAGFLMSLCWPQWWGKWKQSWHHLPACHWQVSELSSRVISQLDDFKHEMSMLPALLQTLRNISEYFVVQEQYIEALSSSLATKTWHLNIYIYIYLNTSNTLVTSWLFCFENSWSIPELSAQRHGEDHKKHKEPETQYTESSCVEAKPFVEAIAAGKAWKLVAIRTKDWQIHSLDNHTQTMMPGRTKIWRRRRLTKPISCERHLIPCRTLLTAEQRKWPSSTLHKLETKKLIVPGYRSCVLDSGCVHCSGNSSQLKQRSSNRCILEKITRTLRTVYTMLFLFSVWSPAQFSCFPVCTATA